MRNALQAERICHMMQKEYQYVAFISHKSEDDDHARWLWNKLRHYRLPSALCNRCRDRLVQTEDLPAPRKLDQLFLDFINMPSGQTRERLDYSLARSRYLIVICSRHTAENPEWIDHEIQSFLDSGHSPADIFALVVDPECEDPVRDCFPPKLRTLAIKASNFRESRQGSWRIGGRHQAFLGILAGILGVNKDEVERIDRRQKIAAGLTVLAACILCGCYLYHRFAPHYSYFRDYILEDHVAQGIYPLEKKRLHEERYYYKFTRVDGILQSVEYLNYAGYPVNQEVTVLNEGAATIRYTYAEQDDSGIPETAAYYNNKNQLIVRYQFLEEGTRISRTAGEGDSAVPCCVPVNLEESHSPLTFDRTGISKYKQVFEDGKLVQRLFAQGDRYEVTHNHSSMTASAQSQELIYGYSFVYDREGRVSKIVYLGTPEGTASGVLGGVHALQYGYDSQTGIRVEVCNLDIYDRPVKNTQGWAMKRITLDENRNPVLEEYLDENGDRICLPDGYAAIRYHFDGIRRMGCTYLDAVGEPVAVDGYVSEAYTLDENGVVTGVHYLDGSGSPACSISENCYGWQNTYEQADASADKYANYTKILLDADLRTPKKDAPVVKQEEYYRTEDSGRRIYTIQKTQITSDATYFVYTEYDAKTFQFLQEYHCDTAGNLVDVGKGYAKRTAEYDLLGQLSAIVRYDDQNREMMRHTYTYERRASFLTEGTTEETARLGAARVKLMQDEVGRVVEMQYLDETGALMTTTEGYAAKRYTYDPHTGKMDSIAYLGVNGLPVVIQEYAKVEYAYNAAGETISVAYFDNLYLPMINPSRGYASWEREYDTRGNLLSSQFNGVDGPICLERFGYARVEYTFDNWDHITSVQYFGTNGSDICPMNHPQEGYSRMEQTYDDAGNCTSQAYFLTDGETQRPAVIARKGYAKVEWTFDTNGNMTAVQYYGSDGMEFVPMTNEKCGYCRIAFTYNENNQVISAKKYGADHTGLYQLMP